MTTYTLIRYLNKDTQDLHKRLKAYCKSKYGNDGFITKHIMKLIEKDSKNWQLGITLLQDLYTVVYTKYMKTTYQTIITLTILAGAIYSLAIYFNWRDTQTLQSADKYERCVNNTYGMTPSEYLAINNSYPTCN